MDYRYRVTISRQVAKEIKKLPKPEKRKIQSKIVSLKENPRPDGVVKLTSFNNLWPVQVGNYRIIYSIEDTIQIVDIRKVVNRKDAYQSKG